jgi:hypothetical protein
LDSFDLGSNVFRIPIIGSHRFDVTLRLLSKLSIRTGNMPISTLGSKPSEKGSEREKVRFGIQPWQRVK